MQVTEIGRRTTCSDEMIAGFEAGKRSIQLIGTGQRWTICSILSLVGRSLRRK